MVVNMVIFRDTVAEMKKKGKKHLLSLALCLLYTTSFLCLEEKSTKSFHNHRNSL